MKIKTKLILILGVLFLLMLVLVLVSGRLTSNIKTETDNILRNNYRTLEYVHNMLLAVDASTPDAVQVFEMNLQKQELNITETGEKIVTDELRKSFDMLKTNLTDDTIRVKIRIALSEILEMNMSAIQKKYEIAKSTTNRAFMWISFLGALCVLISFILLIYIPSAIAKPIKLLTASIKQIAEKDYSKRLYFKSKSEFGQLSQSFNIMAEKLEEYDNSNLSEIMLEKKRIETLINNMSDPVIGLDENEKVIFVNPKALQVLNFKEAECVNHSLSELSDKSDLLRTLMQGMETDENASKQKSRTLMIYTDNKEKYFESETLHISIVPTNEQLPRLVGHVIILRNVTQYKEIDFAKNNFIATISHELKTPISSIKMSLQLLEDSRIGSLNPDQTHLVDSIIDDTNRLLKITGELLNITQIESGNIQLSIMPVEIREILTYAVNANKTQADQKHIKFEINCPETISKIQADNEKTAWVLTNLISNAVRYSLDNSTIYLTIREEKSKVFISVRDSGMGIAPEYKDKIFNRYFRVPGTQKEGSGLGLSISKEFIEAQGGEIYLESEIGKGSTFTIQLIRTENKS